MPLAYHFLAKYKEGTSEKAKGFSDTVIALFLQHPWPGNVRELENVIERGIILSRSEEITVEDLPSTLTGSRDDYAVLEKALERTLSLDELESEYIIRILEQTGGNKCRAAQILGIDRRTLYRKLAQLKSTLLAGIIEYLWTSKSGDHNNRRSGIGFRHAC